MEAFLRHIVQPKNTFTGFKEYNVKFKGILPEDPAMEKELMSHIKKARDQFGPNEVLPLSYFQKFLTSCKKDVPTKDSKKKMPSKAKQTLSEALKEQEKPGQVTDIIFESLEKEVQSSSKCNVCQEENCVGHVEELEFEDEYSAEESHVEADVKEFLSKTLSGKDLIQAQNHIIYFDRKNVAMEDKLMKGKDRYMKALQSYLKGNMDAEVRLMSKAKVKVADLNVNMDSLKTLLRISPGKPRICECNA